MKNFSTSIQFLLQHNGYQVTCCDEAGEALQLAKSEDFDLFLLDNWLPDVTGTELTQQIRQFKFLTHNYCSKVADAAPKSLATY